MVTKETTSWWRPIAAATGALAIGLTGLVGVSTAASAQPGPGQEDAPTFGSLTIHTYAGEAELGTHDGSPLDDAPDLPPLAGVTFLLQQVTEIDDVAVDLSETAGWDVVADLNGATPESSRLTLEQPGTPVTTNELGVASATGLDIGVYYVTVADEGPNTFDETVLPFLVSVPLPQGANGWLYDVHAYPKNQLDNDEASVATMTVDDSDAVILGEEVSWTIQTPTLSVRTGSSLEQFVVTDNLAAQLEFVTGRVTASVINDGVATPVPTSDFENYFDVELDTDNTLTIEATQGGLEYLNTLPSHVRLSFTFDTAVIGTGNIVNEAIVNFGGSDFTTNQDSTQWGSALITKFDAAATGLLLSGAVFDVYLADGDQEPAGNAILNALTTFDNGEVEIAGLKAGDYVLVETAAPTGYILPLDDAAWTPFTIAGDPTPLQIGVENTQQTALNLPLTGANGQLLMTIAGIALVLVAGGGALAVRNRSKSAE